MKLLLILLPLLAISQPTYFECSGCTPIVEKYPQITKDVALQGKPVVIASRIHRENKTPFNGLVRLKGDKFEYLDRTDSNGAFKFNVTDIGEFTLCAYDNKWVCLKDNLSINKFNHLFIRNGSKWQQLKQGKDAFNYTLKDGKMVTAP